MESEKVCRHIYVSRSNMIGIRQLTSIYVYFLPHIQGTHCKEIMYYCLLLAFLQRGNWHLEAGVCVCVCVWVCVVVLCVCMCEGMCMCVCMSMCMCLSMCMCVCMCRLHSLRGCSLHVRENQVPVHVCVCVCMCACRVILLQFYMTFYKK